MRGLVRTKPVSSVFFLPLIIGEFWPNLNNCPTKFIHLFYTHTFQVIYLNYLPFNVIDQCENRRQQSTDCLRVPIVLTIKKCIKRTIHLKRFYVSKYQVAVPCIFTLLVIHVRQWGPSARMYLDTHLVRGISFALNQTTNPPMNTKHTDINFKLHSYAASVFEQSLFEQTRHIWLYICVKTPLAFVIS